MSHPNSPDESSASWGPALQASTRPVWMYADHSVKADLVLTANAAMHSSQPVALYLADIGSLSHGLLAEGRISIVLSPTRSPFSHDANLIRSLVSEYGIVGICGISSSSFSLKAGDPVQVGPNGRGLSIAGRPVAVSATVAGSDEALGVSLRRDAVCYRPTYLYDAWMGSRIARGLEAGIGVLVCPGSRATLDDAGRVWLKGGPKPAELAGWILSHPTCHIHLLGELTEALIALNECAWEDSAVLTDGEFGRLFAINCRVAPFVGFPLFSLTSRTSADPEQMTQLNKLVSTAGGVLPAADRRGRELGSDAALAVRAFYRNLERRAASATAAEVVAATVLMSDVRRIVIDSLRRRYAPFNVHARHRDAA